MRATTIRPAGSPPAEATTVHLAGPEGRGWSITGKHPEAMAESIAAMLESQRLGRERRELWGPITGAANMEKLAGLFPMLRAVPGAIPWDAIALNKCARGTHQAAVHAARFCLWVWNPYAKWSLGKFDLFKAWADWDDDHRRAALAWLQAPFYP